ncbi:MAG: glycosyltransferase family 4 protein [Candidatus Paceibacterota bacterium]|jgi:glycosyltransferase involved in cell wall biosynthesis
MKICFLTAVNSIHSKRWAQYFLEKGHQVYWLSLGIDNKNEISNINFYLIKKFPLKFLRPLFYVVYLKKILREIKPDILHVHQLWIDGLIGVLSGFHPLVVTPWGSDVLIGQKSKIKRPLIEFILEKADLITTDGENTKAIIENLGINSQKIKRICFGVDVKKFKPEPESKELKRSLGITNSSTVISLRSLMPIYDLKTLIQAIPLILEKAKNAKFIIVGEGPEKEELLSTSRSLGVFDSVKFIGSISNEEIHKYLNLADVYVSTALSDSGIAASTAEAMACGLPVVVTDTGDNNRWIKNGENGFVIPIKNPEALAEKIIYLIRDKKLGEKIGGINRKVIEERNNYYKEMEKMERIYINLLS